jgi:hypothetical protein
MLFKTARNLGCALVISTGLMLSSIAVAGTAGNPLCPGEEVSFDPGNGEDIIVPAGFMVSVFAKGLNFPTGIAFRGNSRRFEVYVLESGSFPASPCNNGVEWQAKGLPGNPFTPDLLVLIRTRSCCAPSANRLTRRPGAPMSSSPVVGLSISLSNAASKGGSSSRRTMGQTADAL